jgi:hypothetical protein
MLVNQFKIMAVEKQIIAFIDPRKFGDLLGDDKPKGYRQNGINLDNGNHLVYIQVDGKNIVDAYDEAKAKAASIILVADTFNFQYVPEVPFKVLFHTQTNEVTRVQRLREVTNLFQGDEKSMEVKSSHYQKIADFINKNEGVSFESIYGEISVFDPEEETLTDDIFNAIYEQKDEDAIEKAVSKRDKYINNKSKL